MLRVKGNYKIGCFERLYSITEIPDDDESDNELMEVLVKKVKVWYMEYYVTNGKNTWAESIFMTHKHKREEAIKYLKLMYEVRVYDVKRNPDRNEKNARFTRSEQQFEEYKLSKDKRAKIFDNLKIFEDYFLLQKPADHFRSLVYFKSEEELIYNFWLHGRTVVYEDEIRYV